MEMTEALMREASEEEEDTLHRNTKRSKESHEPVATPARGADAAAEDIGEERRSYRDTVMGNSDFSEESNEEEEEECNTSDDDVIEEEDKVTWFGMGMTKEEKIVARRP